MIFIILLVLGALLAPPILLVGIGIAKRKTSPDTAKILYILAAVYILVGGGICASLIM